MGSTCEARRAGMYPAKTAMRLSIRMVVAKVGGSEGSVANKSEAIPFATMKDATVPMAIPASARRRVRWLTASARPDAVPWLVPRLQNESTPGAALLQAACRFEDFLRWPVQ